MTSVFATFDKNGDGLITKQELRESLKNIQISATEKEAEEMMIRRVDVDGDGMVNFDEFKTMMMRNGGRLLSSV
ncbi:Calmodulin-like protein 2 [Linum perenne]